MDVTRLSIAAAIGKKGVPAGRGRAAGRKPVAPVRKAPAPQMDKAQLKAALDKLIRNTRFQYDIKDELGYFIVRIIDRDTDKVIREIPSKELQRVREGVKQLMGILFDEEI